MNEIKVYFDDSCFDWVETGITNYMGKGFHWMIARLLNGKFVVILRAMDGWRVGIEKKEIEMFPDCIPSYFFEYPPISGNELERIIQEALQ